MSVINKMLRDLDSRQAAGENPGHHPESRTGMTGGILTQNIAGSPERKRRFLSLHVLAAALLMAAGGAAGAWWYLSQPPLRLASAPAPLVVVSSLAPVSVAPASVAPKAADVMPVAAAALPVVVGHPAPVEMPLKMDNTFKDLARHAAPSKPDAVTTARTVVPERPLAERTPASTSALPVPVTATPPNTPRPLPAMDALAQAQSLWNAGSHEAAMELVRETMAVVERTSAASPTSGSKAVLASLARELARMELAAGQVSRALEMLTQRESALSEFADIWALRGNAAQRLGRHDESVAAYLMALKLRPDETRWLLGAAVSLAAQGKTASAADLAEKARASGALSREVATYLRQLGVPLREH